MIALLERYTNHLSQLRSASSGNGERGYDSSDLYDMPTDIKLPHVGEFVNVYQVHCPRISLNNGTRNVRLTIPHVLPIHIRYHIDTVPIAPFDFEGGVLRDPVWKDLQEGEA